MPNRHMLVIEDDAAIRMGVVDALQFHGYGVHESGDGAEALELALTLDVDLILLDLVLPGRDGLEILREVRSARPQLPVIILTARGEESDRVKGLRLGADDYVVKPFSVRELIARAEAVLRRSPERPSDLSEVGLAGGGRVDLARCEVSFGDGTQVELSQREVELLSYLVRHAGRVISREEILQRVWRIDPAGMTTRTIDMHVARLREKLRDQDEAQRIIVTVRGRGYRWGEEVVPR